MWYARRRPDTSSHSMVRKGTLVGIGMIGALAWASWRVRQASAARRRLLTRIRGEYREMPGLSLTLPQAYRLWQLDSRTCTSLIAALVKNGELQRTTHGRFVSMA